MKKILAPFLLLLLVAPAFGQVVYARWTEMNANVPFWIAFTNNLDSGSWSNTTTLSVTGGCSPSIVSSYFKDGNPPFNHQEIMALVNPGTCTGTLTVTDSVYSLSTTLTVRNPVTYYVRKDGGTRYTQFSTSGQCSGLGDQSYAAAGGSGVNQNCAMGDLRELWVNAFTYDATPESLFNFVQMAGGDTVIVRGAHDDSTSWRIGNSGPNSGDYFFLAGNNAAAGMPPPPWGIASQRTQVLGENYASCNTSSDRTHINPGYGIGAGIDFSGTNYVTMACFDEDDHESCGRSSNVDGCNNFYPYSDYMNTGVNWNNQTTNVTLQDFYEHGAAATAMSGPTGDGVLMNRVSFLGNAAAGWNADNGTGDQRDVFLGSTVIRNYVIGWSGCAEQWPIVGSAVYGDCTDDNVGGYGDAFGTATVANLSPGHVWFDIGEIYNSTQDGHDALHLHGAGSTMTITRTLDWGSMGDQIKIGGSGGLVVNSIIQGNCNSLRFWQTGMTPPEATITGWSITSNVVTFTTTPGNTIISGRNYALSNFNNGTFFNGNGQLVASAVTSTSFQVPFTHANGSGSETGAYASSANGRLSDFCRGGSYASVYETDSNTTAGWYFNTSYSSSQTTVEAEGNTTPGDTTQVFQFQNNVAIGFISDNTDYSLPVGTSFGTNPFTNPGGALAYNLTWHWPGSWNCPNTSLGEANAICADPLLTDESDAITGLPPSGVSSYIPTSGSPVLAAGAPLSALTACAGHCSVDYFGNARNSTHPSMGAIENPNNTTNSPSCSPVPGHYFVTQSITCTSTTPSSTTYCTIDGTTPTTSSPVCTSISVATNLTLNAISAASGLANSAVIPNVYTIGASNPAAMSGASLKGVSIQ